MAIRLLLLEHLVTFSFLFKVQSAVVSIDSRELLISAVHFRIAHNFYRLLISDHIKTFSKSTKHANTLQPTSLDHNMRTK